MSVDEDFSQLLELEFDLNVEKLFNMSLNFEHLKESLTFLFSAFKKQHAALKHLVNSQMNSPPPPEPKDDRELESLKGRVEKLEVDGEYLRSDVDRTVEDTRQQAQQLSVQKILVSQHSNTLQGHEERIKALENMVKDQAELIDELQRNEMKQDSQIADLKKRVNIMEQAEPGERVVERVVEKKEIVKTETPKNSSGQFQDLRRQLEALRKDVASRAQEKDLVKMQKELAQWQEEAKKEFATKEQLEELRESHGRRLKALEEELKNLSKEMSENKWQEGRIASLEQNQRKLKKQLDDMEIEINMLKDKLRGLLEDLNMFKENMDARLRELGSSNQDKLPTMESGLLRGLKLKVDIHETKLTQLTKQMNDLLEKMSKMGRPGGHDDSSALMEEVEKLKKEIAKLKQDLMNMLLALENQLNAKAENQMVIDLEATILAKLESVVQGLTKKLADKADTKKALKLLEKQIKSIYELLQSRHGNEDQAMFSKKPLGGVSCASCEKDLVNLYGRQADHQNWNRLPPRDPSDRIARIGQGFSRLLSSIRIDYHQKTHKLLSPSQTVPFYDTEDSTAVNNTFTTKLNHQDSRPKTAGKPSALSSSEGMAWAQ